MAMLIIGSGIGSGQDDEQASAIDLVEVNMENETYFSLETGPNMIRSVLGFPRHLWQIMWQPTWAQMRFFLRDGFAFRGNAEAETAFIEALPRIGRRRDESEELYMLTWQPAESFVRQAQLIHEQEEGSVPRATYINSDEPLVYLFNSHPAEMIGATWADYHVGEMNVIEFNHMIAYIFEKQGIPSLVEDRDVRDIMRPQGWTFAQSYQASRIFIEERINQHPTLQFFFDLHRDGIARELATITIGDRTYGRVLFVIGGHNPAGYVENYQMARQLHNMLEAVRPGLSRGVSVHTGIGQNGVYNQDVAATLQLLEIGTVETTVEEAMNTIEVLADVLATYILQYIDER